jgi:outer membrane protein OmpA-like peptidoglycan-associated protein/uncharacterized protein YidB (DUF937 family)
MFDRIIEEAAGRFGLAPDKAKQLLGLLIGLIFNAKGGGSAGFLQAFRSQGMGDMVQSWLGSGPRQPISPSQLEGVLGADALGGIASKLGLPQATVSNAAAAMLPDAVNELSDNSQLPMSLPDRVSGWLGGLGSLGAATMAAGTRAAGAGVRQADAVARGGLGRLLPWLALAALVIAGFLAFRSCKREEVVAPAVTPPAKTATPTEAMPDLGRAVERSTEAATAALAKLTAGFTADDLVKALNLMVVHFDTDSANISADSQDILSKAADAIKRAPAGTRIEIGGHTDNTGDAAANQKLSEARAAAVAKRLGELGVGADMLTSKGYGQDMPVADNNTEEGRAQNRRMEFTVMK